VFKLHSRGNDRERITRAHQAAEALFASKPPINEPAAPDSANQSVLAISPTVPVCHDELGTSVNREPQTKHGIARSQFAAYPRLDKIRHDGLPGRRGLRLLPFAGYRRDHRAGVERAATDAHRAAEAAADLKRRLNDRVAREARRRDRLEIGDFVGAGCGGPFRSSSLGQVGAQGPHFYSDQTTKTVLPACALPSPRQQGGSRPPLARHPTGKEKAPRGGHGAFGLRAPRGAVEGPHFRRDAKTALLILKTPGASQGSAISDGRPGSN
jgi:hypothetical protein